MGWSFKLRVGTLEEHNNSQGAADGAGIGDLRRVRRTKRHPDGVGNLRF